MYECVYMYISMFSMKPRRQSIRIKSFQVLIPWISGPALEKQMLTQRLTSTLL